MAPRVLLTLAAAAATASTESNMVASPPSTLLAPGVTTLPLQLSTSQGASCRWDVADVPFASMGHDFAGAGTTAHSTTLTGLSGGLASSAFYVQCDAFTADPPLVLAYRSMPDSGNAPFPRLGNLWGSGNFLGHPEGLAYAASRASLWLGSTWTADEIAQLRALNPYTIALTSINACETNDQLLPDSFYLLNITQPPATKGRLQSWPGAWRLDLTNPAVQDYQAALMYCLVVYGGTGYGPNPGCNNATVPPMVFDGLFTDNVFMDDGAGVNSQDIYHNPFIPINQTTGKPFADFNEAWKLGMIAIFAKFRSMMPYAILDGHAMDVMDGNITATFNAISIGFTTVQVLERYLSFSAGLQLYTDWMTMPARAPKITMIESAVRFQLGYGYGFDHDLETLISFDCTNSNSVPGAPVPGIGDACSPAAPQRPGYISPQTFLLARSEYQYMRFGLGFTLMGDGYFAHELGDSWHGQDWVYDETLFNLGLPLGNATTADVLNPNPPPVPPPIPLPPAGWSLYVRTPDGSNASWAFDDSVLPFAGAPASVRVDIQGTASASDGIDLSQVVTYASGAYLLSFWARASRDDTPGELNSRKNGGDWHNEGLDVPVVYSSQWTQFNITFVSASDGAPGRLSWFVGEALPGTSVWINSPSLAGVVEPLPVYIRDFDCGAVVLNGDTQNNTVQLPAGLRRLTGQQAPLWQYFVDDNSSAFQPLTGTWSAVNYDSGYHGDTTPSQEEVRPANGFYHHWEKGAHQAQAGGSGASARFDLRIPAPGAYNVSLWWPAAVPARTGWATAMRVSIAPGALQATVDLTAQGGDAFLTLFAGAQLDASAALTIECPADGGDCIADAVLVESAARWNDGSAVSTVTLQPLDAIVLQKTAGVPAHCAAGGARGL